MMNDNEQHLIVEPHGLARGFVSEYTNKVKILKTFANYEEAYIYYIDLIKEKYNYIIPDDLWLIFINDNNIKLVIDLHGSKKSQDFDIEFGTLNNLSADFSTIKELEEAFTENKISNIIHNNPFKGGAITEYVYGLKDVDVIQVEINGKYRDYNNLEELEKLIKSFENFIKQYKEYINDRN